MVNRRGLFAVFAGAILLKFGLAAEEQPVRSTAIDRAKLAKISEGVDDLESALDELDSNIDEFDTENWRDTVPNVRDAAAQLREAFEQLKTQVSG